MPKKGTSSQTALLISPVQQDHDFMVNLFRAERWKLTTLCSLEQVTILPQVPVVITERDLPYGTWRDVLNIAQLSTNPPLVIVTSSQADELLWAEVLNLGAHDVLAKPFDRAEVNRVLSWAWIGSARGYQSAVGA